MTVGVIVSTNATPGNTDTAPADGSSFFVAGLTERGATTRPVLIRSMSEYRELLGKRVAYGALWDQLATFFGEGGNRAYVARVVGDGATAGTATLEDSAGVDTLRLDAANPGAWSAELTYSVEDGIVDDTFTVTVALGGQVVEVYPELSSPAEAATIINGRSGYITATDLGSPTAAPGNNPAVVADVAVSAGSDDRGSLEATDYIAALDRFPAELGAGVVAIPGQDASTVGTGLFAHANPRRRIALLSPPAGATIAQAVAAATALRATTGAEAAGMFYPHVNVPDGAGGNRTISPEGYVAGVRARALRSDGPWRAAAGEISAAQYVTGPAQTLTPAEVNQLNDSRVNPLRVVSGSTRVYGWRSLSLDAVNFRHLTGADTLNVIAARAQVALEQFVFRTIDPRGHLFSDIEGELVGILEPMRAAGGLYERVVDGQVVDPGYAVDTGPDVNPPPQLAAGEVDVNAFARISPVGELFRLNLTKVALSATL